MEKQEGKTNARVFYRGSVFAYQDVDTHLEKERRSQSARDESALRQGGQRAY